MDQPRSAALMRLANASLAAMSVALLPSKLGAQSTTGVLSVYGRVTHTSGQNKSSKAGDHVLLYDFSKHAWIGPALTDNDGRYAFYDLVVAPYILALYVKGKSVWENQIEYRGVPLNFTIIIADG
jgi:hypothetical protein